mmetsp:Transcript_7794/g.17995  ORF Transcript_7794/g.17995 Transcript_7794/m.17995 type:complete len:225 (+) Transcript_7794:195-869(+)
MFKQSQSTILFFRAGSGTVEQAGSEGVVTKDLAEYDSQIVSSGSSVFPSNIWPCLSYVSTSTVGSPSVFEASIMIASTVSGDSKGGSEVAFLENTSSPFSPREANARFATSTTVVASKGPAALPGSPAGSGRKCSGSISRSSVFSSEYWLACSHMRCTKFNTCSFVQCSSAEGSPIVTMTGPIRNPVSLRRAIPLFDTTPATMCRCPSCSIKQLSRNKHFKERL